MKNKKLHYHLIGICGSSMSAIACFLCAQGYEVTGSDILNCKIKNIKSLKHSRLNITKEIDCVVYTSAITKGSLGYKELIEANKYGIKIYKRSQFIKKLLERKISIGVTGMHGKTTTSSMIANILHDTHLYPSYLIGSEVTNLGKSWGLGKEVYPLKKNNKYIYAPKDRLTDGKANYFVVEACEYDRSFLDMKPLIGVITNIDKEHLDYYKGGLPEIKQAFKKFIKNIPKNGMLFINQDDKNLMSLIKSAKCKVKRITINKPYPGLKLKVLGKHNLLNATMAAKVTHELGINHKIIKKSLNNFKGAKRRMELIGKKNNILVYDDYGHHPAEIKATIKALKEKYPKNRIIMIFQPHQQQRTKLLFKDFVNSFYNIDKLIINNVFLIAGREKETKIDLADKLAKEIAKKGIDVQYIRDYKKINDKLKEIVKDNDIIITQGATDIYKVGKNFLKN